MGIEQMPDINKIREELDKKNAEMEKKERERIEEEYKRSSEQEKPTEESIKEKKDKREESEEKEKEGEKEGIKDEDIIQKLTPENIKAAENVKAAYKKGKFIEVKIKRPSGEIEDGWVISNINPKTGEATVLKFTSEKGKDRSFVDEIVTLEELKEWNKPETKEPKKKKEKESATTKTPGSEIEGPKEKEKEDLEREITKRYYDKLKKIQDMPDKAEGFNKTAKLKMKKTEKCFQLIESWKDLAYLDNYKGIQNIFSELNRLEPSIFLYDLKKAQITNKVALSMARNYEKWKVEDKEKLKIIKDFVNKESKEKNIFYSKDKTFKEIAQILALKDIPYKNNIDVIVKKIKNPDIKAETLSGMADIEKESIEKKEQSLRTLKEDIKHDKLPPDKIIMEQLEKLGVDPKAASEILSKLVEALENPEIQKKLQELNNLFTEIIKGKEKGEIPEDLKKVKEYIKDEKKESPWKTAFGATGWAIVLLLFLFIILPALKGVDYLSGQAGGKKKEKK